MTSCLRQATHSVICNTTCCLLSSYSYVLCPGWMDDLFLVAFQHFVAETCNPHCKWGHRVGLNPNITQCELINHFDCTDIDQTLAQIPESMQTRWNSIVSHGCSTVRVKTDATLVLGITLANVGRVSKFFHC